MSARYTITDTMSESDAPAAVRQRSRLATTCFVWVGTSLPASAPVTGSRGTWPDTNTNGPARTAGEYAPAGVGTSGPSETGCHCRSRCFIYRLHLNEDAAGHDADDR